MPLKKTPFRTRFNGVPAVEVEVFRTGTESIIDITQAVRDYIADKQPDLPQGLQMTFWRDRSEPIKARLGYTFNQCLARCPASG